MYGQSHESRSDQSSETAQSYSDDVQTARAYWAKRNVVSNRSANSLDVRLARSTMSVHPCVISRLLTGQVEAEGLARHSKSVSIKVNFVSLTPLPKSTPLVKRVHRGSQIILPQVFLKPQLTTSTAAMDHEKRVTSSNTLAQDAAMETTSRLLAALVNEALVDIVTTGDPRKPSNIYDLTLVRRSGSGGSSAALKLTLCPGTSYKFVVPAYPEESALITPELDPADIVGPIIIEEQTGSNATQRLESRPEKVFDIVAPWICTNQEVVTKLRAELKNSADNQGPYNLYSTIPCYTLILTIEKWLKFECSQHPPELGSPLIVWEQRCIKGHPTHPVSILVTLNPVTPKMLTR
jgi:hypothetical protein